MSNTHAEQLVLVENDQAWRDQFVEVLQEAAGESRHIVTLGLTEFFERFRGPKDFEEIRYFFVDLELGAGSSVRMGDIWGLDRVLPHVRRMAPWIPVACISRYVGEDMEVLSDVSLSDFDGIFPKKVLYTDGRTYSGLNRARWRQMLLGLDLRRNAGCMGRGVSELRRALAEPPSLSACTTLEFALADKRFEEGISLLGLGGNRISLQGIVSGFSGLHVIRAAVSGHDAEGNAYRANWLIKWGSEVRKLQQEADAHFLIFRQGLHRKYQVPLLNRNAVHWGGIGFLVYAFEKNALSGLDFLNSGGAASLLAKGISELYGPIEQESLVLAKEVSKWVGPDFSETSESLDNLFEVSVTTIHGDLHLRNILVRDEQATFIDFARSDRGPVVADLAKLLVDWYCFSGHLKGEPVPLNQQVVARTICGQLAAEVMLSCRGADDVAALNAFLRAYLEKYLTYTDVPDSAKALIRAAL